MQLWPLDRASAWQFLIATPPITPKLARVHLLPASTTHETNQSISDDLGSGRRLALGLPVVDEVMQSRFFIRTQVLEYRVDSLKILRRKVGVIRISQKEAGRRGSGNQENGRRGTKETGMLHDLFALR